MASRLLGETGLISSCPESARRSPVSGVGTCLDGDGHGHAPELAVRIEPSTIPRTMTAYAGSSPSHSRTMALCSLVSERLDRFPPEFYRHPEALPGAPADPAHDRYGLEKIVERLRARFTMTPSVRVKEEGAAICRPSRNKLEPRQVPI
jgi:hypothetical protein